MDTTYETCGEHALTYVPSVHRAELVERNPRDFVHPIRRPIAGHEQPPGGVISSYRLCSCSS